MSLFGSALGVSVFVTGFWVMAWQGVPEPWWYFLPVCAVIAYSLAPDEKAQTIRERYLSVSRWTGALIPPTAAIAISSGILHSAA